MAVAGPQSHKPHAICPWFGRPQPRELCMICPWHLAGPQSPAKRFARGTWPGFNHTNCNRASPGGVILEPAVKREFNTRDPRTSFLGTAQSTRPCTVGFTIENTLQTFNPQQFPATQTLAHQMKGCRILGLQYWRPIILHPFHWGCIPVFWSHVLAALS